MFGLSILESLGKGVIGYFSDKSKAKAKLRKAELDEKIAISLAKIDILTTTTDNRFKLDMLAMQNMNKSYKDEFFMIMFSLPMILAFIPSMQEVALKGFNVIAKMPKWYVSLVVGMVVVTFGMRQMLSDFLNKNKISNKGNKDDGN